MAKLIIDDPNKLKFWDHEKNKDIDINKEKASSKKEAWWRCPKCDYSWHTPINKRKNANCPCCDVGSVIKAGVNDVLTKIPDLEKDYASDLNHDKPDIRGEGIGSHQSYIWRCHVCGDEWEAPIYSRIRKKDGEYIIRKCPVCGKNKRHNTIGEDYPELKERYSEQNVVPLEELKGNYHQKLWWKCLGNRNHPDFKAALSSMIRSIKNGNSGCPYCHGIKTINEDSLGVTNPELISEWSEQNEQSIFEVSSQSHMDAIWECDKHHVWSAPVYTRAAGYGMCRICHPYGVKRDSIIEHHPEVAEYYSDKNKHPVEGLSFRSNKKVLWKCVNGRDHEFRMSCNTITKRGGLICTICNMEEIVPGINDLPTLYPTIAAQYDDGNPIPVTLISAKNSDPDTRWICEAGHSFQRSVAINIDCNGRCPICERKVLSPSENSIAATYPKIVRLWDPAMNIKLPTEMLDTTTQPISLTCEQGHSYPTTVRQAVKQDCKCPICSYRMVIPGQNSLVDTDPYLADEWSPSNDRTPETVTRTYRMAVKWICPECGGEYSAKVNERHFGDDLCPYCNDGKALAGYNTLEVTHPEVASCWSDKNVRAVTQVTSNMSFYDPIYWDCPKCGGTYRADFQERLQPDFECPICNGQKLMTGFNSLADTYPNLAKEWLTDKNGFPPDKILPSFKAKVWWRCPDCNSSYTARIPDRLSRTDCCPYCNDRLVKAGLNSVSDLKPAVAAEWSDANERPASDYLYTSYAEVLWTCSKCGNDFIYPIHDRYDGDTACPFCDGRRVDPNKNSFLALEPELAKEWDPSNEKKPYAVFKSYSRYVKWICAKCGGRFNAIPKDRYIGDDACPYCSDRRVLPGLNSLSVTNPELAKEWSPNNDSHSDEVFEKSSRQVLWICPNCGGEYAEEIRNRSVGDDSCPYCSNRRVLPGFNSLADTNPELISEWSPNNTKRPEEFFKTSAYSALWICPECGGEYAEDIRNRSVGDDSCPYCANKRVLPGFNSLADTNPELLSEWSTNNTRRPEEFFKTSAYSALWICPECGGEYAEEIRNRSVGDDNCPYCTNKRVLPGHNSLQVQHPDLMQEWCMVENAFLQLNPDSVFPTSTSPAWWQCQTCGEKYVMNINQRVLKKYRGHTACYRCSGRYKNTAHIM